jgi:HEAT repeat protein
VEVSTYSAEEERRMEKETQKVNELVRMLVEGTTYEMLDAAQAVGAYGAAAVDAVAPLLRSPDRETRWRAAVALERIGAPSVEALVAGARDPDFLVRVPAIWALEHVGDDRAVPALVENLNSMNECCRWMAAAALRQVGGERERAAVEAAFADDPAGRGIIEELIAGS